MSASPAQLPARAEIDPARRWRLDDLLPDLDAWEAEFAAAEKRIAAVGEWRGRLGESAAVLAEVLDRDSELGESLDRVFVFAHLQRDQDTRDAAAQARARPARRSSASRPSPTSCRRRPPPRPRNTASRP